MANHQSLFDVLAFYSVWGRQFRWVIKEELRRTPGLGWGCEAVGHLFIDRRNRESAIATLNAFRPKLVDGLSIMFFPEGTRSRDGSLGPFKKGGFMMALDLGLPILPVTIDGTRHVLPDGSLKLLPGTIKIQIHSPIEASAYGMQRREDLMADTRAAIASALT
jgi:1-acyl-sn-glycerol-3-phosphate acyltransferase